MKRFAALLCVLALALPFHAFAAAQPALTPSAVLSEDGTTITVTVSITAGSTVCGGSFDIAYDSDLVECQSVASGDALSGTTFLGNADYAAGTARIGWIGLTGLSADGVAATATFRVLPTAAGKNLTFTLTDVTAYNESSSTLSVSASSTNLSIPASSAPSGDTPVIPNPDPIPPQPSIPPTEEGKDGQETEDAPEVFLMSFTDVAKGAYYYDAVKWAVENNITTGTGVGTTFSPDMICTRAQVVTFLWRAAGCPSPVSTATSFKDVAADAYYKSAVLWALENGITTGTGDGTTFEPNVNCTRGQIVTFLSRAQKADTVTGANPFVDVTADAYYYSAVLWAVENGITTGTGNGTTFEPNANCTRGQVVTFLYRSAVK